MRAAASTLTALLAILGLAAHANAASIRLAHGCAPRHRHTLIANATAELFKAEEPGGGSTNVYGCAYGHKRAYELGLASAECLSAAGCGSVGHEVLAGDLVAYEQFSTSTYSTTWYVIVKNLLTGRVLHIVPTGQAAVKEPEGFYAGVGNVVSIVLESDGAAAWIANDEARSTGLEAARVQYYDVEALDARGGLHLLAAGFDVDPASLALAVDASDAGPNLHSISASRLYWTQGGKAMSSPFDG